jgi:hypothetical protein
MFRSLQRLIASVLRAFRKADDATSYCLWCKRDLSLSAIPGPTQYDLQVCDHCYQTKKS